VAETIETQGDHLALIDSQGGLAALFLVELVSAVWLILEAARKNGRLPAHGAGQSCCSSPRSENTLDRWIQPSHQDWAGSGIAESACLLPTFQVLEDLPVSLAQVTPHCAISISDDSFLQVPRRPTQVIQFRFQLAYDHFKTSQLDPLKGLHSLLQAMLEPLQHLDRG
jgi:hypothetical protein